jgi:hypothetical protein
MERKQILVTGDVALDNNIYLGIRKSPEIKDYGTLVKETKGGSHLLFEIITVAHRQKVDTFTETIKLIEAEKVNLKDKPDELEKSEKEIQALNEEKLKWESFSYQYGFKNGIFDPGKFPSSLKTYAAWELKEFIVPKTHQKVCGEKTNAWRVTEMIGWGQEEKEKKEEKGKDSKNNEAGPDEFSYSNYILEEVQNPNILVFDDGGNNFRNDARAWTDLLFEKSDNDKDEKKVKSIEQVILKTAYPLGHGNLFRELTTGFKNRLTIITSIDEIRKEDVLISKGVSWEQTALDLVYELSNNRAINQLLQCKRLIVTLQSEGALYIEMDEAGELVKCRLSFDPEHLEGDWVRTAKIEGDVFGLMAGFTAAITYGYQEAMLNSKFERDINIEATITRALSATRMLKITGNGKDKNDPVFPLESVCSEIISPNSQFASAFVPIPCGTGNPDEFLTQNWTILEGNYRPSMKKKSEPLFDTAFRFALYGKNELANTPFLKINNLTTYDRREIEALHNVKNLIIDYLKEEKPEKPLSLAVFGMPGSGKSFAVKQLAKSLDLPILEFNLSQFADGELEGAFHLVRDKVLEGKPPIVFWDEFDSQAYKWLQYLLAPMQDGKFQGGQIIHPIGKSIFIFAGGTSYTFETFGIEKPQKPDPNDKIAIKDYELILNSYNDFILKKGPDFKSRLSGYMNIQGPNQLEMLDEVGKLMKDADGNTIYNEDDIQYPVRRALFIRGICGKKDNQELKIDNGLLHALIKTRKFTHGSRSLEKILSYLKTKNDNKLQRSNLPTVSILNMLVDKNFIGLLEGDKYFEFQAFRIAPKIHQNWMKIGDMQGWKLEYHKDYNYLPSHMKDENIAAARRIQKVLDALVPEKINLLVVPATEVEFYKKADFRKVAENQKYMELMAIEEHKGWVETKENAGWKFNNNRNDDKKLHNCIIGWDEKIELNEGNVAILSLKDKNKDKDAIKNFPDILKEAGFVIIEKKS